MSSKPTATRAITISSSKATATTIHTSSSSLFRAPQINTHTLTQAARASCSNVMASLCAAAAQLAARAAARRKFPAAAKRPQATRGAPVVTRAAVPRLFTATSWGTAQRKASVDLRVRAAAEVRQQGHGVHISSPFPESVVAECPAPNRLQTPSSSPAATRSLVTPPTPWVATTRVTAGDVTETPHVLAARPTIPHPSHPPYLHSGGAAEEGRRKDTPVNPDCARLVPTKNTTKAHNGHSGTSHRRR